MSGVASWTLPEAAIVSHHFQLLSRRSFALTDAFSWARDSIVSASLASHCITSELVHSHIASALVVGLLTTLVVHWFESPTKHHTWHKAQNVAKPRSQSFASIQPPPEHALQSVTAQTIQELINSFERLIKPADSVP